MCLILRVLPCRKSGQRSCGRKEEVAAQAVVSVHCVRGLEGDLLLGCGRGHGEVGARRLNNIHGVCVLCMCVDFESEEVVRVRCGRGCRGKWGSATPGDLYWCRKSNQDIEPR